jgi:hypothetical protein
MPGSKHCARLGAAGGGRRPAAARVCRAADWGLPQTGAVALGQWLLYPAVAFCVVRGDAVQHSKV